MEIFIPLILTAGLILGQVIGLRADWRGNAVRLSGYLPTPCHSLVVEQERSGDLVRLKVYSLVGMGNCLQTLTSFDQTLSVEAGILEVNGSAILHK